MAPKLSEKQRLRLIERVVKGGESVSKVCREAGISRVIFYRWLKRYKSGKGVGPKKPAKVRVGRRVKDDQVLRIVALVLNKPESSSHKLSQELPVGNHGVQNVLQRLGLNTVDKRLAFIGKARGLTDKQALDLAVKGVAEKLVLREKATGLAKLSPRKRFEMIEQVVKYGKPVAAACRDFGVSRPTFYKWLARYKAAEVEERAVRLTDKARDIKRYVGQVAEEYEKLILNIVVKHPEYGIRRILKSLPQVEEKSVVGYHGIQNVLRRNKLSVYALREAYAQTQKETKVPKGVWDYFVDRLRLVWEKFMPNLAPAPPPIPTSRRERGKRVLRYLLVSTGLTIVLGIGLTSWGQMIGRASSGSQATGLVFASIALFMGSIFFIYSLKYYLTLAVVLSFSQREQVNSDVRPQGLSRGLWNWLLGGNGKNGNGKAKSGHQGPIGLEPNLADIKLARKPMVSVQIPFYNEKKVVKRAIEAAISFDYPNYEVMLLDDSTDETPEMIRKYQKELAKGKKLKKTKGEGWTLTEVEVRKGVYLKHLHRTSRSGFKGGALGQALKLVDPKVEFVTVFDADFVPYPDTLELFLKYFKAQNEMKEDYEKSNVAVVQGYQWHVLNKSENWITRGVRSEYAGSYVIERSGAEIYGGLKQISGSVYMIRRDVLEELGWKTSITEDFQLTLRLYEKGYKVVYTPYIQAPAECVSTLKRLIRQRMRWAEGHSQNIKKMFLSLMKSGKLTIAEKLETLYLSPYYLQAFFFLVGTLSWLIAETVFPARLPFWTVLWGWSLVLTNMISLPLMNAAGMFLEESEEKDYVGLASFVALSYIVVPFQAYAAFKGFLEKEEGPWFRTPKSGKITDVFTRGKFYRFISGILPGRPAAAKVMEGVPAYQPAFRTKYMALSTANNRFDGFKVRPRRLKWVSKAVLAVLLAFTVTVYSSTFGISIVEATNVSTYWFRNETSDDDSVTLGAPVSPVGESMRDGQNSTNATKLFANGDHYWYSRLLPTGTLDASIPDQSTDTYTLNVYAQSVPAGTKTHTWNATIGTCEGGSDDPCGTGATFTPLDAGLDAGNQTYTSGTSTGLASFTWTGMDGGGPKTCTAAAQCRIYVQMDYISRAQGGNWNIGYNNTSGDYQTNVTSSTAITIPENVVYFIAAVPFIPMIVMWMQKRKRGLVYA